MFTCACPSCQRRRRGPAERALQAAAGLQQLLSFRHACTTATSPAGQQRATDTLLPAAAGGLIELARLTAASGRTGTTDLN